MEAAVTPTEKQARQFLLDFLSDGPRDIAVLQMTAEADGLTRRDLNRAADMLNVVQWTERHEGRARTWWRFK